MWNTYKTHCNFCLFLLKVVEDGYEFFADRQLVTIFSAPNYCGEFDNAGAMMSVDDALMCSFQILKPAEKKPKYSYMPVNSATKSATPPRGAKVNFFFSNVTHIVCHGGENFQFMHLDFSHLLIGCCFHHSNSPFITCYSPFINVQHKECLDDFMYLVH